MKFNTDTYVSDVLSAANLRQGGGKKDHYTSDQKVCDDGTGLLALGEVTLHFCDEVKAKIAISTLTRVGIAVTQHPAIPEWLTYNDKAATVVARSKWLGQRQGFAQS